MDYLFGFGTRLGTKKRDAEHDSYETNSTRELKVPKGEEEGVHGDGNLTRASIC